jgi:hypothetical protein
MIKLYFVLLTLSIELISSQHHIIHCGIKDERNRCMMFELNILKVI